MAHTLRIDRERGLGVCECGAWMRRAADHSWLAIVDAHRIHARYHAGLDTVATNIDHFRDDLTDEALHFPQGVLTGEAAARAEYESDERRDMEREALEAEYEQERDEHREEWRAECRKAWLARHANDPDE